MDVSDVTIEVEVAGRTDIEVGKIVDFVYPKAIDKMAGTSVIDAIMAGPAHYGTISYHCLPSIFFSLNKHEMHLELTRFI